MLDHLSISLDLPGLISAYLDRFDVDPPGQRARLKGYDASRRMTYAQWWRELATLRDHTGKPHVGLDLGSCIAPEHCGVVGYLCLCSSSVMEVTTFLDRYQRLLYGGYPGTLEIRDDALYCEWVPDHDRVVGESDEALISALIHLMRHLTGDQQLAYRRIGFMHETPADVELYEDFFDSEVSFGCRKLFLDAPIEILHLPIRRADPALQKVLVRQADERLASEAEGPDFMLQFKKALLKAIRKGQPTQQFVAAQLNISSRTLHRRLESNDLSFRPILSGTRAQLAKEYLEANQLTLSEIALLLGFSDQSAFSRAFSRWTGKSPLAYRKSVLES